MKRIIIVLIILLIILVILGLDNRVTVTNYDVVDNRINSDFKIALITDTHSCDYGEKQEELIYLLDAEKPHIILLSGDIIDDEMPIEKGYETVEEISQIAPAFYVTGNHEIWSRKSDEMKSAIRSHGITVLEGDFKTIDVNGNTINIMGVDDPSHREYENQIELLEDTESEGINFLLAHRPDRFNDYININPDYIFSGHAHGGQWRFPILLEDGLLAPNQGLFPKYTKGIIDVEFANLIISRGLSRESTRIPRIYNSPEIVMINFKSE